MKETQKLYKLFKLSNYLLVTTMFLTECFVYL